jgi:hypothetical protein
VRIVGTTISSTSNGGIQHSATDATFRDNPGYNPVPKIVYPFGTISGIRMVGYINGGSSTPTTGVDYVATGSDLYVLTDASVIIKDSAGNTVLSQSLPTIPFRLPVGWKINFVNTPGFVTVWGT